MVNWKAKRWTIPESLQIRFTQLAYDVFPETKASSMQTIRRATAAAIMFVGSVTGLAQNASAQNGTPCMTQNECDLQEDLRDTAARKAEYARNVRNQEDAHAAVMQLMNQARAQANGNRDAKLAAILQRRRDAFARSQH